LNIFSYLEKHSLKHKKYVSSNRRKVEEFVKKFEKNHPLDFDKIVSILSFIGGKDNCENECTIDCLINEECSYGQIMEFYQKTQNILCPFHKSFNYTD